MPRNAFMPRDDNGKVEFVKHLAATLPRYAAILNISDAELATLDADAIGLEYAVRKHQEAESRSHKCTARKNHVRDGGTGSADWTEDEVEDNEIAPVVTPGVIPRPDVKARNTQKLIFQIITSESRHTALDYTGLPPAWRWGAR